MFRLLGGMILGALILLALSDSVRKDIEPYLERGSKLTEDLLNRVREAGGVQGPEVKREAEPLDQTDIAQEPSSSLPDQAGGDAGDPEGRGGTVAKDVPERRDTALLREPGARHQEGPAGSESFPDIYEKARTRLLQAMEILEGKGDAGD